jgi:hypothetical protein
MSQPASNPSTALRTGLADEIVRLVEINRTTINGLTYGDVIFRVHQGRLVEVTAAQTLKLSAGTQLCPLLLSAGSKR